MGTALALGAVPYNHFINRVKTNKHERFRENFI